MSIELFSYGQDRIRTSEENGEPWFVAQDILEILDLNRSSLASLDDEEKGVHTMDTLGGRQKVATINESGLYSLILRSRKPEAKAFKRWITGTVLPALRKTGTYSTAPALTGPALMAAALIEAQSTLAAKDAVIAELEPKAELADAYLTAGGGERLVDQAAKLLGMKAKELRAFMLEQRLMFTRYAACGTTQYEHYADFAEHFGQREHTVNHSSGQCAHYTLTVKPRGIDLIRKRLRDQEEAA
ncbi:BRO family protein [Rhodococcus erythropolis]|uniref:phage antirepressor n=1 Tax=Rhodococcus erythropolis TaxID=1833 RepID=UPI00294A3CB2|nr:BRO family protein [Rhodococcus erythropolis]MDV6277267.1 BRO family protein [Rhodococcus erythropolis]